LVLVAHQIQVVVILFLVLLLLLAVVVAAEQMLRQQVVREAVAMAVHRQEMVRLVHLGKVSLAVTVLVLLVLVEAVLLPLE
jgi:hypothetical protein